MRMPGAHDHQLHGVNPAEGLDARKHPRRPASGEKYLLTSPFIGLPCCRQHVQVKRPISQKPDFLGADSLMARYFNANPQKELRLSSFMPFDNRSAAWHLSTGSMIIPEQLSANCRNHGERQRWLDNMPAMLEELTR